MAPSGPLVSAALLGDVAQGSSMVRARWGWAPWELVGQSGVHQALGALGSAGRQGGPQPPGPASGKCRAGWLQTPPLLPLPSSPPLPLLPSSHLLPPLTSSPSLTSSSPPLSPPPPPHLLPPSSPPPPPPPPPPPLLLLSPPHVLPRHVLPHPLYGTFSICHSAEPPLAPCAGCDTFHPIVCVWLPASDLAEETQGLFVTRVLAPGLGLAEWWPRTSGPQRRLPLRAESSVLQESGCGVTTLPPPSCLPPEVIFLEKRVSELEKDTAANGEQHSRLRQENLQLVHRANALEEQLKEQELRACEMVLEETRRQKELLCKMEREKTIEIENLQARLQQLDEENSELRSCTPCLKASIERLEEEKQKLLDEIEELSLRLSDEQENRRKLGDRLSHERHQFQRDKEATQELIEDLRKQLEHLQLFKLEAEQRRGRSSSAGLQEYNSRTRESELEQEVRRLKQDNRSLKEQNDELNGQIINLSIQGAKNLFSTAFSESLAAEISSVSRDELMEAIQKQEEINFRLQDYIDRIIVAIMETNPSILEVK
uniref:FIP-RBD domain-containing protein n=1 Tax=Sus scrofa TaxID=9823 RepID=A0A4X1UMF9_PIG